MRIIGLRHAGGARAGLVLLLSFIPGTLAAQQPKMNMVKIAEDVYTMVEAGGSSNSTFIITSEGVVVFDHYITESDQTLAAIRKLTDKKVRYLFSSHPAADHSTGAWWFREDKPVYIASKNQLRDMLGERGRIYKELQESKDPRDAVYKGKDLILPDLVFEKSITLRLGGITFEATLEGPAHSTGDVTLYIPQKRVFLMGDLLNSDMHAGGGSLVPGDGSDPAMWIKVLGNIMDRRLPVDTYVPGHGPVHLGRGVKDLEEAQRYFVAMRDVVATMMSQGKSLDQIIKEFKVPAEFAHYAHPERLQTTLPLYYWELMGIDR
jgi:glyoxylase-like metal-dependent hydrolase (beta-lactamase superfamily II)